MTSLKHRRKKELRRVALIVETTRAYGRRIIEGVLRYVKEHEPWLIELEPRALPDPLPGFMMKWDGDGIIARVSDRKSINALQRLGIPIVHLKSETTLADGRKAPIVTDQRAIGHAAADHFHERGYRNFGFVGSPGLGWSDGRLEGFRERAKELRCKLSVYVREPNIKWTIEGLPGPNATKIAAWVRSLPQPVGVLAADDFVGLKLLNACRQHGIAVPDQVAVLGVDDEESICRFTLPPMSSIIPDNHKLGYEAASLLDQWMENGITDSREVIRVPPLGIHVRQSSDTIAIDDPFVAKAMAFIRENACRGIGIDEVARHVALASSTLQRRFQRALNIPVYESILRVKIERVKSLLEETELSLKEIAARTQFEHMEHLASLFKKRVGKTMLEYREAR